MAAIALRFIFCINHSSFPTGDCSEVQGKKLLPVAIYLH